MAEIINLNRARKSRNKAEKAARAQTNRITHGLTKAERTAARSDSAKAIERLEQHRLERPED